MNLRIHPSVPHGTVKAIASKSAAHRLLICSAFAQGETTLRCEELNEDIEATVRCLCALGATITRHAPYYHIQPIRSVNQNALLDCGESGSTLRFLVPVVCMLGANASFLQKGRLPQRPLSPLREELEKKGAHLSKAGSNPLLCGGKLTATDFTVCGGVSSQFISGLLFALAISGKTGSLRIEGTLESAPYVEMTVDALLRFGVPVTKTDWGFEFKAHSGLRSPAELFVEGDWSNAAFGLCLGAMGKEPVTVTGLNMHSTQGDRAILSLLRQFGATVAEAGESVTVSPAPLHGIDINASQIPDLVPVLATVASIATGKTTITHAERLRLKESDRLNTVRQMLTALGADVWETEDGLIIEGNPPLTGGVTSSFGDHRIAMSAAVASVACADTVTVEGAEAASKSYPAFWEDMRQLGIAIEQV